MKVLIVEDETAAYENLVDILHEAAPDIEVVGNTESVTQTISWLEKNEQPALIFMDIHLSDGSAFSIFDKINLETPIVFTTAYDRYAIEAFKVNSIDYILKPVKVADIKQALEKYRKFSKIEILQYLTQLTRLAPAPQYIEKILLPHKDKLLPIDLKEVAFFYTSDKSSSVYLKNGQHYLYSKTLEQIMSTLNPACFFRANKQFIINRDSVTNITVWFDSRLLISMDCNTPERIYISKNKASEFKSWMIHSS